MKWFLVLLFWNPAMQEFGVADGWWPIDTGSLATCEIMEAKTEMYVQSVVGDHEFVVDCVKATSMEEAAAIMYFNQQNGDAV